MAEIKKKRIDRVFSQDRWWFRIIQISAFTITPLAVGVAIFLYKEFATIGYVNAGDERIETHCDSNTKLITVKLDHIAEKIDSYREELMVRVADRWTKRDHERWENVLNKRIERIEDKKGIKNP